MQIETRKLVGSTPGTNYELNVLYFGPEGGRNVYMQASLHGDELPGSLVCYYLHQALLQLEEQGALKARIVLVPYCNPIGLGQMLNYQHIGRFHFATAQNFNRLQFGSELYEQLVALIEEEKISWSQSADDNTQLIRTLLKRLILDAPVRTETESLHQHLLSLACDAELVLDLHCDNDSVMHMYATPTSWPVLEPLARYLGSACQILSPDSGANSFDEVLACLWERLKEKYPEVPLELGSVGTTVEFRGEYDLCHELAAHDANAIIQYLNHLGYIELAADAVEPLPALINPPHPLGGLCYIDAPVAGIAVYLVKAGDWVEAGQPIVDIVDPITLAKTTIKSPARGVVFAHSAQRMARPERKLMSISSPDELGNAGLSP